MSGDLNTGAIPCSRRAEIFFWCFATAALFLFLGHNALWESEDRWAEITREMILSGNYLHPSMNWFVYFDKPHLTYWLIVPFAKLFGGVTELTARAPSALAALAALYGTMLLGRNLFDRRTGLLAAWIMLGCYSFLFWGRTAAADMANVAAIILASAFFFQVEAKANFFHYLLFYLICFVGALAKGLPALVMPFVIITPYLLMNGRWKKHLRLANFGAAIIGAGIFFLPFYLSSIQPVLPPFQLRPGEPITGLELVWRENIVRVFQPFDHKDPFYSYLYNLPRILLPWTPFFLIALLGMIREWKELPVKVRAMILGALLMFLLFSASGSRRWYYILPMLPFCAIVTAGGLLRHYEYPPLNRLMLTIYRYAVIIIASLGVAALISLPVWNKMIAIELPALFLFALPAAGILTLAVMLMDNQPKAPVERLTGLPRDLAATVLGVTILMVTVFSCIYPSFTQFRTEKAFYLELRHKLLGVPPSSMLFWQYEADPKLLFYMDAQEPMIATTHDSPEQSLEALKKLVQGNRGRRIVIFGTHRQAKKYPADWKEGDAPPLRMTDDLKNLEKAAAELKLPLDIRKPNYVEPFAPLEKRTAKKRAVWVVDVPEQ